MHLGDFLKFHSKDLNIECKTFHLDHRPAMNILKRMNINLGSLMGSLCLLKTCAPCKVNLCCLDNEYQICSCAASAGISSKGIHAEKLISLKKITLKQLENI